MRIQSNILLILISLLVLSCGRVNKNKYSKTRDEQKVNEHIEVYDFEGLESLLYTDTKKTHIVNFWALWCAPCVKELPIIQKYHEDNPDVEITLVSLDFPEQIESILKPFLSKKGITTKVVLLDDPDSNSWIDKIDPNWSGAIPFTIIFNHEKRSFHERAFESIQDLESEIHKTIDN